MLAVIVMSAVKTITKRDINPVNCTWFTCIHLIYGTAKLIYSLDTWKALCVNSLEVCHVICRVGGNIFILNVDFYVGNRV